VTIVLAADEPSSGTDKPGKPRAPYLLCTSPPLALSGTGSLTPFLGK
jgi:hypothetical protein